jgi:hypothetical protein
MVVAYFYCGNNVFEKRENRYILGCIVKQIVSQLPPSVIEKEGDFLSTLRIRLIQRHVSGSVVQKCLCEFREAYVSREYLLLSTG